MALVLAVFFNLERIVRTYINDTVLMYPMVGVKIWKTWIFLKYSNLTKSRRGVFGSLSF